jgi:hypothetical protein
MFTVIMPEHHYCFYKSTIDLFVELLQSNSFMRVAEEDRNNATFILTKNKDKGLCGGAMLLKKKLYEFPKEFVKNIAPFVLPQETVWKCTVFLHFENDNPLSTSVEDELFCQSFYEELYEKLGEFGKKEEIGFLCMSLDPGEHLCTEEMGLWPYLLPFKPEESPDGLFYGVLPLTGSQVMRRK